MSGFAFINLQITKGNVKIAYMLNICSQFLQWQKPKDIPKIQGKSCKVKTKPKRTTNYEVQKK